MCFGDANHVAGRLHVESIHRTPSRPGRRLAAGAELDVWQRRSVMDTPSFEMLRQKPCVSFPCSSGSSATRARRWRKVSDKPRRFIGNGTAYRMEAFLYAVLAHIRHRHGPGDLSAGIPVCPRRVHAVNERNRIARGINRVFRWLTQCESVF